MCNAERMSSSSSSDDEEEESKRDKELISVGEGRMTSCGNQEGGHAYIQRGEKYSRWKYGRLKYDRCNIAVEI